MRRKNLSLVISQAKVPNVDLHDGTPWTLGGYLAESGGNRRRNKLVFGLHVDQDDADDDDDVDSNKNEVSG